MSVQPAIVVTSQDFDRIQAALSLTEGLDRERLDSELARAKLVEPAEVSPNLVTMNSEVTYENVLTGAQNTVRLVYPHAADVSRSRISVLAPLGSALLGRAKGQQIEWTMPGGSRTLRILEIVYQPEAAGDWGL